MHPMTTVLMAGAALMIPIVRETVAVGQFAATFVSESAIWWETLRLDEVIWGRAYLPLDPQIWPSDLELLGCDDPPKLKGHIPDISSSRMPSIIASRFSKVLDEFPSFFAPAIGHDDDDAAPFDWLSAGQTLVGSLQQHILHILIENAFSKPFPRNLLWFLSIWSLIHLGTPLKAQRR